MPLRTHLVRINKEGDPEIQFLQNFLLIGTRQGAQHATNADVNSQQYYQDDDDAPEYAAKPVKD